MNEEYTYNIGKYTIGVDKNGEDGIGLTVAIINDYGEMHFLGNCYGDNARCIDLLIRENQQLKDIINKAKEYTKNHTIGNTYGISHYFDEFDIFSRPSSLLEILDNKGE